MFDLWYQAYGYALSSLAADGQILKLLNVSTHQPPPKEHLMKSACQTIAFFPGFHCDLPFRSITLPASNLERPSHKLQPFFIARDLAKTPSDSYPSDHRSRI